jgi:cytochrome c peroxidase
MRLFPPPGGSPDLRFAHRRTTGRVFGLAALALGTGLFALAAVPVFGATNPICNLKGTNSPCIFDPEDEEGTPLGSLKSVAKPVDSQLAPGGRFINSQQALVALGKALFWDQQVGSDGQACASCHFVAGADPRTRNQVNPGLKQQPQPDTSFQIGIAPNHELTRADFPIHKLADPNRHSAEGDLNIQRDSNDVISSSGVFLREFSSIQQNGLGLAAPRDAFDVRAMDNCESLPDFFNVGGVNVRRVEPRNTPTMINAMFNNRNFWDSRAQDVFNGVNPFGARDQAAKVFEAQKGVFGMPTAVPVRIIYSSLASQAVGPPLSEFEMSCNHRKFPDVGHKMLTSTNTPLAQQVVSASDSVLGGLSNSRFGGEQKGLSVSYLTLVTQAFQPRWWESVVAVDTNLGGMGAGTRLQIEANFSLFWGVAVQAYMETLRGDDSKLDVFFDSRCDKTILTPAQLRGLRIFQSAGGSTPVPCSSTRRESLNLASGAPADARCAICHGGPETTGASIDAVLNEARLERMAISGVDGQGNQNCAIYDAGHFNTGVRLTKNDFALGATDPSNQPLGETMLAISGKLSTLVPTAIAPYGLVPPMGGTVNCDGPNVMGTFKAPQLRNVELTGPYFHNGGQLTLRQVIDFYNRGGDFDNPADFDPNVHALGLNDQEKSDLVSFMIALTDERVAFERAPFDHPSLCVANGEQGTEASVVIGAPLPGSTTGSTARAADQVLCIGAVGRAGRTTRVTPFMNADEMLANP